MPVIIGKAPRATSYIVHHKLTTSTTWTDSATLGDVSSYTITGLTPSTNYHVAVTAINSSGSSAMSAIVTMQTAATPATPTGLSILQFTEQSVTVGWMMVAQHTYKISYKIQSDNTFTETTDLGAVATYQLTGLLSNTVYDFSITAFLRGSSSEISTMVSQTTLLSAPTRLVPVEVRDT